MQFLRPRKGPTFSTREIVEGWLRPRVGKALLELQHNVLKQHPTVVTFIVPGRISKLETSGYGWSIWSIARSVVCENRVYADVAVYDIANTGRLQVNISLKS